MTYYTDVKYVLMLNLCVFTAVMAQHVYRVDTKKGLSLPSLLLIIILKSKVANEGVILSNLFHTEESIYLTNKRKRLDIHVAVVQGLMNRFEFSSTCCFPDVFV